MKLHFALLIFCAVTVADGAAARRVVATIAIQQKLQELGFDLGQADGKWGARTIKALEAFQRSTDVAAP